MTRPPVFVIRHPGKAGYYVTVRSQQIQGIVVPRGFSCDGASIPRGGRWLFGDPFEGPNRDAGRLHDWLYAQGLLPRDKADDLFYRQLIADGCPAWKAQIMYRAVRWFGGPHWRRFDTYLLIPDTMLQAWENATVPVVQPLAALPTKKA